MSEYHVPDDVRLIQDVIERECPKRYFQRTGEPHPLYGNMKPALDPVERYELAARIAFALRRQSL